MMRAMLLAALVAAAAAGSGGSAAARAGPPRARVVELRADDGLVLKASYFPAAGAGPGVLLLHQGNRDRRSWDALAARLAKAGINTLTLDMRGFGDSGGTPHDKRTAADRAEARAQAAGDLDAAWRFLTSQPGVRRDRIGLGGAGFDGVNNAVQTARRHPAQVRSMVFLSGETYLDGLKFLQQTPAPELFVVANDDEYPPTVEAMELLFTQARSPGKRFVRYPGKEAPWLGLEDVEGVAATGSHGTDMFKTHPDLPRAVADWFVATLITTPGRAPADPRAAAVLPSAPIIRRLDEPGGAAEVTRRLLEARRTDPKAQLFPEITVSIVGYDHLRAGDKTGAIEILKLDALAYPQSPDTHASLSDAYLADGQTALARQEAETALALLDSAPKGAMWSDTDARRAFIRSGVRRNLATLDGRAP